MDDEYIYSGNHRLVIWETNKGPSLGFVRWKVQVLEPSLGYWFTVHKSPTYTTYDRAVRDGNFWLAHYAESDLAQGGQLPQ